jgi:hypothetical protein
MDKEWKKDITDIKTIGDHIIALKFVIAHDTFNVGLHTLCRVRKTS